MTTLYTRAIAAFGREAQLAMLQEECGELIAAVNQRARGRITDDELAAEIADVLIVCEQARLIVGSERVDQAKHRKLVRLGERVAQKARDDEAEWCADAERFAREAMGEKP